MLTPFRADSALRRVSEGWGGEQRKEKRPNQSHTTAFH